MSNDQPSSPADPFPLPASPQSPLRTLSPRPQLDPSRFHKLERFGRVTTEAAAQAIESARKPDQA